MSRLNLESVVDKMAEDLKKACNPTNADLIRRMTAEQLADAMLKVNEIAAHVPFCGNNEECNEIMDSGELIPPDMCKKCLMNWLGKEVD